jgi:quinol monooxygenase YgiN
MAIRLVVTFKAVPGKAQDFADAYLPLQQITHKEQGCERYQLFRATDDPDTLTLLERWTTQADLDKHVEAIRGRGGSPTTPFSAGNPTFERYDVE